MALSVIGADRCNKEVKLFPAPMDTKFLKENQNVMGLPPRLGEHNEKIFNEAGIKTDQR